MWEAPSAIASDPQKNLDAIASDLFVARSHSGEMMEVGSDSATFVILDEQLPGEVEELRRARCRSRKRKVVEHASGARVVPLSTEGRTHRTCVFVSLLSCVCSHNFICGAGHQSARVRHLFIASGVLQEFFA